jgi:hypothetical protein
MPRIKEPAIVLGVIFSRASAGSSLPPALYLFSATGHRRRERAGKKGTGYEWGNALSALDAPFSHSFPVPFLPGLRR